MNRINYRTSMAPVLEDLFDKFSQSGPLKYCIICLRTERRLVKNRAFSKFTSAMKLSKKHWQHQQICYICERQADKALKFLNAATFAAAIDTIFSEIIYQKRYLNRANVFESAIFNSILNKFGLDMYKTSPLEWDLDLEAIRRSTQLIETQPLIVDNLNSNTHQVVGSQAPAAPEELYVIPDDPPASVGEVTAVASREPVASVHTENVPQPFGTMIRNEDTSTDTFMLGSSKPKISEALVILDDDDDPRDADPLAIRIENVVSNAFPSTPQPMIANLQPTPQLLMTKSKDPLLVPLESLLEKPKEVYTGDSLLVGQPGGNYSLHPIAIKEGITTIPSLDAKLINGKLIYDKSPSLIPIIVPQNITHLNNPLENNVLQNIVFPQISVTTINGDNNSKTTKRDSPVEVATPNKISKVLPVNELSGTIMNSKIDWEDQIPMDVISYVDRPKEGERAPRGRNSHPVSCTSANEPPPTNVIDLC